MDDELTIVPTLSFAATLDYEIEQSVAAKERLVEAWGKDSWYVQAHRFEADYESLSNAKLSNGSCHRLQVRHGSA